jgi:lysophospholipid acyltransferase (LPLAT)-like uncharacterized protein
MTAALLAGPVDDRFPQAGLGPRPLAAAAAHAARALGATLRLAVVGREMRGWRPAGPAIYVVWHGRILMMPWANARLRRSGAARAATVLASRSRDGALIAGFAACFGLPAIRGSSSRGGAAALRALASVLRDGADVVVVPDGPRGPARRVQPGVAALAALTGAPVVPLAFAARPAVRLRTWDRLLIPLPFARAALVFGVPIHVPRDAARDGTSRDVGAALDAVTEAADALVA